MSRIMNELPKPTEVNGVLIYQSNNPLFNNSYDSKSGCIIIYNPFAKMISFDGTVTQYQNGKTEEIYKLHTEKTHKEFTSRDNLEKELKSMLKEVMPNKNVKEIMSNIDIRYLWGMGKSEEVSDNKSDEKMEIIKNYNRNSTFKYSNTIFKNNE